MLIEVTVVIGGIIAMAALVAKIYEWRQDVLYGPYIKQDDDNPLGCV